MTEEEFDTVFTAYCEEEFDTVFTAYCEAYTEFQREFPQWKAFFTAHHQFALRAALEAIPAKGMSA